MEYLLAFLKAVGDIAGAINNIYQFGKNVQEFFADPTDENRQRYETTYWQLIGTRRELAAASGEILIAIANLDRRIFQEVLSDKLGDIDQALQDLDNWRRTHSEVLQGAALDRSAGAVADMLEYNRSGLYPRPAVVFPFIEVLTGRLAILKEADPGFCKSSMARRPIEEGIALIRSAASEIEAVLRDRTDIQVRRFIRKQRDDDPLIGAVVSYHNLSGTVLYRETIEPSFGIVDPAFDVAVQRAVAAAEPSRARGFMEDLQQTQVPNLRSQATTLEESLRLCELEMLTQAFPQPISSIERARFILERQGKTLGQSVAVVFGGLRPDRVEDSATLDVAAVSEQLLSRRPTKQEGKVLTDVAQLFGYGSALQLLIDHPDSAIE